MGKNLASTPRRKPAARQHAAPPPAPPIAVDDDPLAVGAYSNADADDTSFDDISLDADSLRETEEELGISDWIDPDTGEPAEDTRHHLEDH
jgi:hypothetical protein